jgi:hypothetical protein
MWPGGGTGTGPPGSTTFVIDVFSPTLGQTAFTLSATPSAPTTSLVWINGVLYEEGLDYTVSGTTLTWLNIAFSLGPPDLLEAYYQT